MEQEIKNEKKVYLILEDWILNEYDFLDEKDFKGDYIKKVNNVLLIDLDKRKIKHYVRSLINSRKEDLRDFYIKILAVSTIFLLILNFFNIFSISKIKNAVVEKKEIKIDSNKNAEKQDKKENVEIISTEKNKNIVESYEDIKGWGGY